jgi:imidazoleglycerol phosphate dehydratase HisB
MLRATVETAMTEDMTLLRQRLESHLQEAVQETIKSLADRIAEHVLRAVAEHATERTAAIVAEARQTHHANAEELDAKIGLAVREAVSAPQKSSRKSPPTKRPRKSPK